MDFILADTTDAALFEGLNLVMQKAEQNKLKDYVVIVPDTKTMMAEKYLLSICKTKAFANIYIYSLNRLLNKISPVASDVVLSKQASIMIVRKIILDNQNNLVCYKKTALTNGFVDVVYGTISQLKTSNISAAEFYEMTQKVSPSLKIKMQDIALIFDEYQKYIENKYLDQSDMLHVLETSVPNSEFIKNAEFFYLGFESITAEAISVFKQIIKSCKHFSVGASYMAASANSHIADNEIFNKFKQIADTFGYDYIPKKVKSVYSKDFEHIKNNLYSYPPQVRAGSDSVQILNASNTMQEVEFVAQKIAELVFGGIRYNQIGVICANIEEYQETIEKVFDRYGFSYFVSKPYDYAGHPLFGLVKSYLNIVRKNYEKTAVIEFLSNILLDQTDKIANFINYIEQYGIDHNAFKKPFEKFDENIMSAEEFAQIENLRLTLVHHVSLFDIKKERVSAFNAAIKSFLEQIDIDQKLEKLYLLQEQDKIYAAITKQAKEKLDGVLNSLDNFLAEEEMSIEMYQSLLTSGLVASDVSILPVSQDSIIVSSVADGLYDIDSLFILGATDGAFPVKQQDCGIILDSEIKQLGEAGQKTIEPTIKTINRRERFKAYEMLLLAKKQLFLSYHDGAGEDANKPSNIIDQLIYIFGGKDKLKVQKYNSAEEAIAHNICALSYSNKNLEHYVCKQIGTSKSLGKFDNAPLANSAYYAIKDNLSDGIKDKLDKINQQEEYDLKNAKLVFFASGTTSISQLEKYFTCPFLFFANYGLRLKENPTSKMQAMDVGNVLHKVAELFMAKYKNNTELDIQKTAKTITNNILSKEYVQENNKYLVKIVSEEAIRLCQKLAEEQKHSHFKPIGLEEPFGANKKLPAVKLTNDISLEGKIDRIDAFDGRFRIIDYKTGKIEDNIKRVFYGKKIQLISYLMAMQQSGLKPAGVVYFPIRNEFSSAETKTSKMKGFFLDDAGVLCNMDTTISQQNPSGTFIDAKINKPNKSTGIVTVKSSVNVLTEQEFEDIKEYCIRLSQNAIEEILSGYIMPSPIKLKDSDHLYCENCAYKGICGVQKTKYANGRKCYTSVSMQDISKIRGEK